MSKIGNKPIKILAEVKIEIKDLGSSGQEILVTGPKGTLTQVVKPGITIKQENDNLIVVAKNSALSAMQGLYRSLIFNMVYGVTTGWNKGLELKGVGFRAQVSADILILTIGFSHTVEFPIPKGINITVTENKINVTGIGKQEVGEVAAKIRSLRPPEPYKGKGIRYIGEIVRKKAGKQAVKIGGAA